MIIGYLVQTSRGPRHFYVDDYQSDERMTAKDKCYLIACQLANLHKVKLEVIKNEH